MNFDMDVVKICAMALIAVLAVVLLKETRPELAVVMTVCASILIVASAVDNLFDVVYSFYRLSEQSGVDKQSLSCVVKIIGIGYIAEFANNICVDANCKSIGDKVLFASKIAIALTALPVLTQLFELLRGFLL